MRESHRAVLGPTLWNILYNEVLETPLEGEAMMIAFADDLALIVSVDDKDVLIRNVTKNLGRIDNWMKKNELSLPPEKTEALILRGKRKRSDVTFRMVIHILYHRKVLHILGCPSIHGAAMVYTLRKLQREQRKGWEG